MDIIVDTREQRPLWKHNVIRYGLLCGDYTTMKLRDSFVIERKSAGDLYGTITKGHLRFRNEIIRAAFNEIKFVLLIECSEKEFYSMKWDRTGKLQVKPETLRKIMETVSKRYKVEVIWCCGRGKAREVIYDRLVKEERKLKANGKRKHSTTNNSGTRSTPIQRKGSDRGKGQDNNSTTRSPRNGGATHKKRA